MNALIALTVANIRSYLRDRAALFWTLAFPLIFIFMFGFIFQGGGSGASLTIAWADADASAESGQLQAAFGELATVELETATEDDALTRMRAGEVDAVIVVPAGYSETIQAGGGGSGPAVIQVYTDPSRQGLAGTVYPAVRAVLGIVN